LSQPPFPPSLTALLLEGIIAAIADRPGLNPEQKAARAGDVLKLIEAFMPQDAVQIMLIGQTVLFNHLPGDGARHMLQGMTDTLRLRTQSNINGMNRSLHMNLRPFLALSDRYAPASRGAAGDTAPNRAAAEAANPHQPRAAAGNAVPPANPSHAAVPVPAARPAETAAITPPRTTAPADAPNRAAEPHAPVASVARPPSIAALPSEIAAAAEDGYWVDRPYTTWVVETPAEEFARTTAERQAAVASNPAPVDPNAAIPDVAALNNRPIESSSRPIPSSGHEPQSAAGD
jgi:hypothetical protein